MDASPDGLALVAVRVDPESGYLYAPVPMGDVDPIEVVVSFLASVDPDTLEDRALTEAEDLGVGAGMLKVLSTMAREQAGG